MFSILTNRVSSKLQTFLITPSSVNSTKDWRYWQFEIEFLKWIFLFYRFLQGSNSNQPKLHTKTWKCWGALLKLRRHHHWKEDYIVDCSTQWPLKYDTAQKVSKSSRNKKDLNDVIAAPFFVVGSWEKNTKNGAAVIKVFLNSWWL